MNIFEFAMQMEKDMENFYRELAQKCPNKGLNRILKILAEEEKRQYDIIKQMTEDTQPEMVETDILELPRNIFREMKETKDTFGCDSSKIGIFKKAQGLEKESEDYYREKAGEIGEDNRKNIFQKLAEEEKKHCFLLENIIQFLQRPREWLENAEFTHLDEY